LIESLAAGVLDSHPSKIAKSSRPAVFDGWPFALASSTSRHHSPSDRLLVCAAASSCAYSSSLTLKPMVRSSEALAGEFSEEKAQNRANASYRRQ
jgi:hypothetical protein